MTDDYAKQRPFYRKNSESSFKKWHPDIDVIILNDELLKPYDTTSQFYSFGLARFLFIRDLFKTQDYTKVISLGSDTITCSRLDEFLQDNQTPMLCALDYKNKFPLDMYPDDMKPFFSPNHGIIEWPTINSDVTCINKSTVIDEIEKVCHQIKNHEQTAMNRLYTEKPGLIKIVDFPYEFSRVVYNNRAKGVLGSNCIKKGKLHFGFDGNQIGEFSPIFVWKPIGDRLFNQDGKHVKVFHFCTQDESDPTKEWFNPETIQFFVDYCACDWSLPFRITMLFVPPKGHGLANMFIMLTDFFYNNPNGLVHESIKDYELGKWLTFHFKTTDRVDLPVYKPGIFFNEKSMNVIHPMIRKLVSPSPELEKELAKCDIHARIGIHVRRGAASQDSRPGVERDVDAYANDATVQKMIQTVIVNGPENVFLASDSPETKKLFPKGVHTLESGVAVVHGNCLQGQPQDRLGIFLDFFLLSRCKHVIVTASNYPKIPGISTFGYMAAIYGGVTFTMVQNE
jgi:hypothetical protein